MWGFFVPRDRRSSTKPARNKDDQAKHMALSLNKAENKDDSIMKIYKDNDMNYLFTSESVSEGHPD